MGVSDPLIQTSLLGEAIEHAPVAVFVVDEQGEFVAVNQSACALLGYERGELLTLRVADVARDEQPSEDGVPGIRKTTLTRNDGGTLDFTYAAGETTVAGMSVFVYVGR
jgi:PAS domain S-box-containing protein